VIVHIPTKEYHFMDNRIEAYDSCYYFLGTSQVFFHKK